MEQNAKSALVLINPAAGLGKAGEYSSAIISKLAEHGFESKVFFLKGQNGLQSDKEAPSYKDADMILCCGGDGTLNHIINECINSESGAAIGLIPFGNTNSFAGINRLDNDFDSAMDIVLNGKPFRFDSGMIDDKAFILSASFISASSMNFVTSQQTKNPVGYSKHILRAIGELNMKMGYSFHMAIDTADGRIEDDFLYGAVSNYSDEVSKTNDGIMELFLLKVPENRNDALDALNVLRSGSLDHPAIITTKISGGSFSSDTDVALSFDGEFSGYQKEFHLKVLKESLPVITPEAFSSYSDHFSE